MTKNAAPAIGEIVEVPYPYCHDTWVEHYDGEEGPATDEVPTWKPGTRVDSRPSPHGEEYYPSVADAMGAQILTVIGVYKPGRFPTRVFYLRQWRDPDGKTFGKTTLRMTTVPAFRALAKGYRHPFELEAR